MATIRASLVDNSTRDNTGDKINGSEVDANPNTIADILDGTTATDLGQSGSPTIRVPILKDVSAAAGGVRTAVKVRHDPVSGTVTAGDGPAILLEADDSAGNVTSIGRVSAQWVTPTDGGTEAAEFILEIRRANALVEAVALSGTETTLNESGADIDVRIEGDNNANLVTVDAGLFTGVGAVGIGGAAANTSVLLVDPPAMSSAANTNIARLRVGNTAAVTVPAGTTSIAAAVSIEEPNLTATGTITSAVTLYIAAAPTEGGTNNYALWVDSGATKLDGTLTVDGTISASDTGVAIDLVTNGNRIDLDADNDTSLRCSADDNVLMEVGGNDQFIFGLIYGTGFPTQPYFRVDGKQTTGEAYCDVAIPASGTGSIHGFRWIEGDGSGDANNMGYSFAYAAGGSYMRFRSEDTDGASTAADVFRIPDGQLTIDANTTWDDNVFDFACNDCGWHGPEEVPTCPKCGGKVEWHDDLSLIDRAIHIPERKEALRQMEKLGIVNTYGTMDSDKPDVFIPIARGQMFTWSAMAQLHKRVQELERKVA